MNITELRQLVRDTADHSSRIDPSTVAASIISSLPAKDKAILFDQMLEGLVRDVYRGMRSEEHGKDTGVKKGQATSRSKRVARDWYAKWLAQPLHVGPTSQHYKKIGACTIEDLQYAIEERRTNAARVHAAADHYEDLAELIALHGATTVADLSRDAIATFLKREVAA